MTVMLNPNAFCLTKAEIAALAEFASDDHNRPHLTVIHFVPRLGHVVATDGHTLAKLATTTRYEAEPFNIAASVLVEAARALPRPRKADLTPTLEISAGTHPTLDVVFPPYQQVIPIYSGKGPTAPVWSTDAHYLARLSLVATASENRYPAVQCLAGPDECDQILFQMPSSPRRGGHWTVVIMPCRM